MARMTYFTRNLFSQASRTIAVGQIKVAPPLEDGASGFGEIKEVLYLGNPSPA